MEIIYSSKTNAFFAQAYGTDAYGAQAYSCAPGEATCSTSVDSGVGAPNTGFLGMSQDAAIASLSGAVLLAFAIAGAIFVVVSRNRAAKKSHKEQ
jgi:hypothetical protein